MISYDSWKTEEQPWEELNHRDVRMGAFDSYQQLLEYCKYVEETKMRMDQAFPSKYIKAGDLPRAVQVTIERVEMDKMPGGDNKPVLFFQGKQKGLVLNVTNWKQIAKGYGPDSDSWAGSVIELYPSETDFQGDVVPCVRVRLPKDAKPPVVAALAGVDPDFDDNIPPF